MIDWLVVVVIGGFVALDATSFPQIMVSRPLVAGTIVGLALGDPAGGALVGGVLEVFHLSILPIGATRYPEAGTGAVPAAAAYVAAAAAPFDGPALLLAVLFGLAWEWVAGGSTRWLRHLNERFSFDDAGATIAARTVERRHLAAIAADFARGLIVSGFGLLLGVPLVGTLVLAWAGHPMLAIAAVSIAASAAIGSSLGVFGGWRDHGVAFLAGTLGGALLLFIR